VARGWKREGRKGREGMGIKEGREGTEGRLRVILLSVVKIGQ